MRLLWLSGLTQQRKERRLDRRQPRIQTQHDPFLVLDHVFVVGVKQKREQREIHTRRRLDYPRAVSLLGLFVEVGRGLTAVLRMLVEVEAAALCDAFQLAPSERVEVFD